MSVDQSLPAGFVNRQPPSTSSRKISSGIEYLLRTAPPRFPEHADELNAPESSRRLWRIAGIGRDDKFGAAFERLGPQSPGTFQLPTADLLAGMHGFGSPIAFVLSGDAGRISLDAGIWTAQADPGADLLDARAAVLASVLRSLYPEVTLEPTRGTRPGVQHSELVLGVPTVKAPTSYDGVVQYDRIIRSMANERFQIVVLAQPLADEAVDGLRTAVITEMRLVREAAQAESLPSPLSDHYLDLLKKYLATLTTASAVGAWRTAVYLRGTAESLPRLTSVWRSTFSGADSVPDAVRTHHTPMAAGWADRWALPQVSGSSTGSGLIRLFELQTVLASDRLAAYVHLPEREAPGFAVDSVARFDSVSPATSTPGAPTIKLGAIVHAGRVTADAFTIPLDALTKHALVCGVTGSGKSTTVRQLLAELARRGVPFLVIEPAKAEYRALATLPQLRGRLRVLTVGDERGSMLRLNPLAPCEGSSVAVHLDMCKALFSASFGLWAPLPQILERCLHELYADYGWDLARNTNRRMSPSTRWESAFPTLTELSAKVDAYIDALGYRGEVTANMRAALSTRISGLTVGGKGRMFDTRHSTSAQELFEQPVVLELERLADEEDQAFLMGLLLIRLAEHRRAGGPHHGLRHLLVVEEAHRLLARTQGPEGDVASPKTRAVESFANLLAETRAYGQGVLVADQVPVKLAPDVIKNSNLKVTHRLVADDDRLALGSAMVMEDRQRRSLATLRAGEAAVFAEGQDAALLVRIEMGAEVHLPADGDLPAAEPPATTCRDACRGETCCADARAAMTPELLQSFFHMAQSSLYEPGAFSWLWPEIKAVAASRIGGLDVDPAAFDCIRYRASEKWAAVRGGQYAWSFDTTERIRNLLADAVAGMPPDAAERFAADVHVACSRRHEPFPRCATICPSRSCLHRHAAAESVSADASAAMAPLLTATAVTDGGSARQLWIQVAEPASQAMQFPTQELALDAWERLQSAAVGFVMCTAQQVVMNAPTLTSRTRVALLDAVLASAPAPADASMPVETLS